jgi:transposase
VQQHAHPATPQDGRHRRETPSSGFDVFVIVVRSIGRLRADIMDDVNDDAKGGFRRVEVLTGPGRRRQWSNEQKARIAAEAMMPGAVVSQIARRCAALRGTPTDLVTTGPSFVPIVEGPSVAEQAKTKTATRTPEIEIDTGGAKIRLAGGVDTKALTAVLRTLRAAGS